LADLTKQDFLDYVELCKKEFGVKLVYKKSSLLMRLLSVVLFFNRGFLDSYYTTIGTTIYWVKPLEQLGSNPGKDFRVFFHEVQHAHDYLLGKLSFVLLYLFPQVLSVMSFFALLAIFFGNEWLVWLVCLLFLAPIPAPARMYFELRAYMCNAAYEFWRSGVKTGNYPETFLDIFTGSSYYFMWPFEESLIKRLRVAESEIFEADNLTFVQRKTYEFLKKRGLVKDIEYV
jgi:hypothetical protein